MFRFLVTNACGYIGLHVVEKLINDGHFVRATYQSQKDEIGLQYIKNIAKYNEQKLELVETDLLYSYTLRNIMDNINFVIHLTSPYPMDQITDSEGLFAPSVVSVSNILNAALEANVKRVIINSCGLSIAGFDFDQKPSNDMTNIDNLMLVYGKSMVLAEQTVWKFVEERKLNGLNCFEVVIINPAIVLGPLLSPLLSPTCSMLLNLFNNQNGKIPDCRVLMCDVRDLALANIRAALSPYAVGHRHLIASTSQVGTMREWAEILREEFEPQGFKISTDTESDFSSRETNKLNNRVDISRMKHILGIEPTDIRKTILDTIVSFFQHGAAGHMALYLTGQLIRADEYLKENLNFSILARIKNDNNQN